MKPFTIRPIRPLRPIRACALLCMLAAALPGEAADGKLQVVCTLPTLEALAREVGGEAIETVSLAKGDQDPHFVSPTPVLMQRTRSADLFIELGMGLEPWAELVAAGSGNPRITLGSPGRLIASWGVPRLDVPQVLTRAEGDIHPEGNPHLWLDPVRAKRLAAGIARALEAQRPAEAEGFGARLRSFESRIDEALYGKDLLGLVGARTLDRLAIEGRLHAFLDSQVVGGKALSGRVGGWLARAAPLRGARAVEHHKIWAYFARTFGMELRGTIEEKPGIPPGPQHLQRTVEKVRAEGVRWVLVDNFYDPSLARRVAEEGGARLVVLPNQVRGEPGIDTYFDLIDHVLGELLEAAAAGVRSP